MYGVLCESSLKTVNKPAGTRQLRNPILDELSKLIECMLCLFMVLWNPDGDDKSCDSVMHSGQRISEPSTNLPHLAMLNSPPPMLGFSGDPVIPNEGFESRV